MVARVTRLVAEKFVLSTFPRALTTLSSMCSRAVRALESSPGLIMMMDNLPSRADHALQHVLKGSPGLESSPGQIMMMDRWWRRLGYSQT